MNLILIDGGPASGKNTLGELLIKEFKKFGKKAVLLDLDTFVEKYNPKWIWNNENQKELDLLNARIDYSKEIDKLLCEGHSVIAIGERFLSLKDTKKFISRLKTKCVVQLYHLKVPFFLREKRLHERGPHSLIDLKKDQNDRDLVKKWPGFVYENTSTPEVDSANLMILIQKKKGLLKIKF